jgi:polyketide cyclase/dehydrase/lipid transport protein
LERLGLSYAEAVVSIAKPIDEVFGFLADGAKAPRWMPRVMQSTPVGYNGGVGATYSPRTVSSLLGRKWVVYRIVHYQSPITLGVEATSLPGRPTARFQLSPTEPGTTTVTVHAEFTELGAAVAPNSAGRRWATHLVESLPRIKSELESGATGAIPPSGDA